MNPQSTTQAPIQPTGASPKKRFSWLPIIALVVVVLIAGMYIIANLLSGHASAAAGQVIIDKSGFSPATIRVTKGQQVTWTNQDKAAHKVVSDQSGSNFDSEEDLMINDSFSYTFDSAGTYSYHDPLGSHNFTGTVIVE